MEKGRRGKRERIRVMGEEEEEKKQRVRVVLGWVVGKGEWVFRVMV